MSEPAKKLDLARAMINLYPEGGNRTLAKALRDKYPTVFASIEDARVSVRKARGAYGNLARKTCKPLTYTEQAMSQLSRELACQEAGIPDETEKPLLPFDIGTGDDWLGIADLHIPQHSKMAIETAIDFGKKEGCKNVLINGDAVEFSKTSRFAHDPSDTDIYGEIKALTQFLKYLRGKYRGRIIYKAGNHSANLLRHVWQQAPALASLPCLRFEELLGLANYGIEYVDQRVTMTMGKLVWIHGHEYKGGSPVYPAQWLLRKARTCAVTAHFHRSDTARGKTALDAIISCWSMGCLRSPSPDWSTKNEWNWGFCRCNSHKDGNFEFRNMAILSRGDVCHVVPA